MNKSSQIQIAINNCADCRACSSMCPMMACVRTEASDEDSAGGRAVVINTDPNSCIKCNTCQAMCPNGSVAFYQASPGLVRDLPPIPDFECTLSLLKTRRSTVRFQHKSISLDTIKGYLASTVYSPSYKNDRSQRYVVLSNPEAIEAISDICYSLLEDDKLYERKKSLRLNVFNDAPHVIIVMSQNDSPLVRQSVACALMQVQILLHSNSQGGCFSSVFDDMHFNDIEEAEEEGKNKNKSIAKKSILRILDVCDSRRDIVGALMIGYPSFVAPRLPARDPIDISFI